MYGQEWQRNHTHQTHFQKNAFLRNTKECNPHKTLLYEGGLNLSDIGTKNVREDELNPRLGYAMVIIKY